MFRFAGNLHLLSLFSVSLFLLLPSLSILCTERDGNTLNWLQLRPQDLAWSWWLKISISFLSIIKRTSPWMKVCLNRDASVWKKETKSDQKVFLWASWASTRDSLWHTWAFWTAVYLKAQAFSSAPLHCSPATPPLSRSFSNLSSPYLHDSLHFVDCCNYPCTCIYRCNCELAGSKHNVSCHTLCGICSSVSMLWPHPTRTEVRCCCYCSWCWNSGWHCFLTFPSMYYSLMYLSSIQEWKRRKNC